MKRCKLVSNGKRFGRPGDIKKFGKRSERVECSG